MKLLLLFFYLTLMNNPVQDADNTINNIRIKYCNWSIERPFQITPGIFWDNSQYDSLSIENDSIFFVKIQNMIESLEESSGAFSDIYISMIMDYKNRQDTLSISPYSIRLNDKNYKYEPQLISLVLSRLPEQYQKKVEAVIQSNLFMEECFVIYFEKEIKVSEDSSKIKKFSLRSSDFDDYDMPTGEFILDSKGWKVIEEFDVRDLAGAVDGFPFRIIFSDGFIAKGRIWTRLSSNTPPESIIILYEDMQKKKFIISPSNLSDPKKRKKTHLDTLLMECL